MIVDSEQGYDPDDHEPVFARIASDIAYVLRTVGGFNPGGSVRDGEAWRTLEPHQLVEQIMIHLRAGLHPVLSRASVVSGTRVARHILDEERRTAGTPPEAVTP